MGMVPSFSNRILGNDVDVPISPAHLAVPTRLGNKRCQHNYLSTLFSTKKEVKEKFNPYCKYQAAIHNDHDKDPHGFRRFLVDSPLLVSPRNGCDLRQAAEARLY